MKDFFKLDIKGVMTKKDAGQVAVIMILLVAAYFFMSIDSGIPLLLGVSLAALAVYFSMGFFIKKEEVIDYNKIILSLYDSDDKARMMGFPYPLSSSISQFETVRLWAVNDGKTQLAEELEKKIVELKITHDQMVDKLNKKNLE